MRLEVYRTERLYGVVSAPGSKSDTHREIFASLLADGKSTLTNYLDCDDTRTTINACEVLGAKITKRGDTLTVYGTKNLRAGKINCVESGTTLRLLTPIAALADGVTEIYADGRLKAERPIEDELDAMRQLGVSCYSENGHPPIHISGPSRNGGRCKIRGDITSQYISGLLLYLSQAENASEIELTTVLKSKDYVGMTLDTLRKRGVAVDVTTDKNGHLHYLLPPHQKYLTRHAVIPGDYSAAENILVAAAITKSAIMMKNLYDDEQGDKKILDVLERAGAVVRNYGDCVDVDGGGLHGIVFDATDNPDIIPAVAVLALRSKGRSVVRGVKRLVDKESDRLAAIMALKTMGGKLELTDGDTLTIYESELHGAEMDSRGDHRNVMAYAVAGLVADGKTIINDAATSKSYPSFVKDMQRIGAKMKIIN